MTTDEKFDALIARLENSPENEYDDVPTMDDYNEMVKMGMVLGPDEVRKLLEPLGERLHSTCMGTSPIVAADSGLYSWRRGDK